MVTLTPRAAQKVKELMAREADPGLRSLRVAVEGGGCSGFQYALGFDGDPQEGDAVADLHGLLVLVDRQSLPYLAGAEVDFVDALTDAGFRVTNPNVAASCGCGSSFHAHEDVAPAAPSGGCGCSS